MPTINYTCIYCLEQKEKKSFNTEHVLPKSFGVYGGNTMTLNDKVCSYCNQKFGNTIDGYLARDTLEGTQRFKFGLVNNKKKGKVKSSTGKYAKGQVCIITEGDLNGLECKLEHSEHENKLVLVPMKHDIGCRRKDGLYDFYSKEDIPIKAEFESNYPLHKNRIFILKPQEEELTKKFLIEKLGDETQYEVYTDNSERACAVKYTYSADHFRAYAKIAFNYFAYFNTAEVLLQKCFDPIRHFILEGNIPNHEVWKICKDSFLPEGNGTAILAHFIRIKRSLDHSLIVDVALNNSKPYYQVCLAPNYSGSPVKTDYGHVFDFPNKKIEYLIKSSIVLPYPSGLILMPKSLK